MNLFDRVRNFHFVLFAFLTLFISSCIQDSYDLSKGLNTQISIGGDSLALPIGETSRVLLSTILTNIDLLKITDNGEYSILRKDSMSVKVDALKPITFTITPPTIPIVELNFTEVVLPPFDISEIQLSSPLPIPNLDVNQSILPINYNKNYSYPIPVVDPSLVSRKVTKLNGPKATKYIVSPIQMIEVGSVDQTLTLAEYPLQLKRVNKIMLTNNLVKIKFNRQQISTLGFSARTEKIESFRIDFPTEYNVTSPTGVGARIDGHSFIIENAILPSTVDEVLYTLKVESVDLSATLQNRSLDFVRQIPYNLSYTFEGETNDVNSLKGKNIEVDVKIESDPVISDLAVETNQINVDDDKGTYKIHKQVTTIPHEILSVSNLNFKDGAYLQISIANPNIAPFAFTAGVCEIKLPSMFRFKRAINLDLATNIYKIPYNQLFKTHRIGIAGAAINKTFPENGGDIFIDDDITYKVSGFKLAPVLINSSQVEGLTNRKYNFSFLTNLIQIENAEMVTREAATVVPSRKTELNINKFVSDEVLKLYSATMATPVKSELRLKLEGMPASIDSVFFKNYTIKMPPYLKFVAGTTNSKNEVILNRGFKVTEGFVKIMELEKLDFGAEGKTLEKGFLNINDSVTFSGSVSIKGVNIKSSDIGTVIATPSITIDDVTLGLVEGQFAPKLDPITKIINLDLPSYLMADNVKLDVTQPVITVSAGNTMGIPVDVDVVMTPKRKGVVLTDAIINTKLSIAAATTLGELTWSHFWLATSAEGVSAGYTPNVLPNLASLLKKIPDQIEMKVTPSVTSDHHKVDLLAQKNQLDVKYDVHIPMNFGADFQIAYLDTISNLADRLHRLVESSKKLELTAAVQNQIPLELTMDIKALDVTKKLLSGISISKLAKVASGNIDGTAQTTKLLIEVTETEPGALLKLDGFQIGVSASRNTTIAGMPLRADQYFSIDLKVLLPKGLTVDLKK